MKPLKPSHREKKRYLLINGKDLNKENIDNAIMDYVGALGHAQTSPKIIRTKKSSDGIILSVNRQMLDKVRASFLMSGKDLRIIRVSGSLKGLEN
jgi:RNase P/RNase MRP subunit POP5